MNPRRFPPRFRSRNVDGTRVVVTTVSDLPHYRAVAERIMGGPVKTVRADIAGTTYARADRS